MINVYYNLVKINDISTDYKLCFLYMFISINYYFFI